MINVIVKKFNFESGASGANAVKLAQLSPASKKAIEDLLEQMK